MKELKKTDNYSQLILIRKQIAEKYYEVYNDYELKEPLNLDENEDITLDFISCTLCAAKKNIKLDHLGNNYVMEQPCLRNNQII